jgi:hypothetical protein|tara:strand:- start:11398 stop:11796 length:399 start_codon:yes stop_codon:yes gene_type:complete
MKSNDEIFEGKTFQDLTKDIYDNQKNKKLQLDLLIQEIHGMIQTLDDAVMVAPLIKELFDVAIKNDEHLVKLASVYQRIIAKASTGDEESLLLSESEKEDLINALQDDVNDMQKRHDEIQEIKTKKSNILEN